VALFGGARAIAAGCTLAACGSPLPPGRPALTAADGGTVSVPFDAQVGPRPGADLEGQDPASATADAGQPRTVICTGSAHRCRDGDYVARFRIHGDLGALRASAITVCRNAKCYSASLATREMLGLTRWRSSFVTFPQSRPDVPQPSITFRITADPPDPRAKTPCDPWCNGEVQYTRAPGQANADGDVYEVSLGTGARIHDVARYTVWSRAGDVCEGPLTCYRFEANHLVEPPLEIR
jgi:hypothetical protein